MAPAVLQAIKDVTLAKQQQLAPRALSQAEVRRLLKEVELRAEARDQAILYTLLFTGVRVGELVHLQVADVTLAARKGTLLIRGSTPRAASSAGCRCRLRRGGGWHSIWRCTRPGRERCSWANVARWGRTRWRAW
ncbi:MAG: tyrosine-type recombinase/integrase [Anaerolineae bacterium]|nr:tyrosine-type recombinase/integrase [Anaerolineae bacterium]